MSVKNLVLLFLYFLPSKLTAQDYNILLLPDSLRKGANMVIRNEEYILTIQSPAKYTLYEKHVYTILNPQGAAYASYTSHYDRFSSINNISGTMFNMLGKEIKRSRKSDWKDYSAYDGFSLLSDSRYKEHEFFSAEYPYTVEYVEEVEHDGTQAFPKWVPQHRPTIAVQNSRFTIVAPADYLVRYKQVNYEGAPSTSQKGNTKTYTWEVKNLPAKKPELSAPPFTEMVPSVIFAPSRFEVQGYSGDMSTWEGFGKFMYQLIKGRDVLPANVKEQVHALTDRLTNDREKIAVLYEYLQKNTRYISIQLGIGGWQPFEAAYVAEKKYGDCKALSNYMIALLKEAGITGKYIEIYSGESFPELVEDFPSSQANHVICCVPLANDTLWLECTSQTVSPGYMGRFTGNRKAILVDESGSKIVHTPVYKAADNLQKRIVKATTDTDGNLVAIINNTYTGLQQDLPHALMYDATIEQREKYLNRMFNLPTYKVISSEYKEQKGIIPVMLERLNISLSNYATITGKRLFINPNIFGASKKVEADTARKYDYVIKDAYRDEDSVEIDIPAGYTVETLPKNLTLDTRFGKYSCSTEMHNNKIVYRRLMEQASGRYPAQQYNDLVKFFEQVGKADRARVVLVKAE